MINLKLEFTKEQKELLKLGLKIIDIEGNSWYYIPTWFKENIDGTLETFEFNELPEKIKKYLIESRYDYGNSRT